MIRFIFLFLIIGLVACKPLSSSNQSDNSLLIDSEFDFGIIPDSISVLHHRFKIENRASDTCYITKIEKSCGCTKVSANSLTIPPLDSTFLDVEIDLGSNYSFFERDINIYTTLREDPYTVFIRASRVIPDQIISQEFPLKISERLRANTPYIIMGNIGLGDTKSTFINVLNTSKDVISFSAKVLDAPFFVNVYSENTIAPNEIGRIVVLFDLSEVHDIWGLQEYSLLIETDNNKVSIPVEAIFVENFSKGKDSPRIIIPVPNYTIDTSCKQRVSFSIENTGIDTLHIRNIKSKGNHKRITMGSYHIPPNSTDSMIVELEKNQKGLVEIGITTNDYIEPYKIIRVYCNPSD